MAGRKRPVTHWIRIIHRWFSVGFVLVVVGLLVDVFTGGSMTEPLSLVALTMLVLLLLSGGWLLVRHYSRGWRARRRRAVSASTGVVLAESPLTPAD